jgi:hypothetical protein
VVDPHRGDALGLGQRSFAVRAATSTNGPQFDLSVTPEFRVVTFGS